MKQEVYSFVQFFGLTFFADDREGFGGEQKGLRNFNGIYEKSARLG